jgi:hypothetical protein
MFEHRAPAPVDAAHVINNLAASAPADRLQDAEPVVTTAAFLDRPPSLIVIAWAFAAFIQPTPETSAVQTWTFRSVNELKVLNGTAEIVTYRGRRAVHLIPAADRQRPDAAISAIMSDSDFENGIIEAQVAGAPRAGAPPDARGFVGISFRVQPDGSRYENVYLRPTNGRADDQLRRNHAVQYTSEPDFPWPRLREESPGKYESYADLDPGAWTGMRIVVSDRRAQLFVNGAAQPCLIVTDLKLASTRGRVALWAHSTTDAYFSRVAIHRQ